MNKDLSCRDGELRDIVKKKVECWFGETQGRGNSRTRRARKTKNPVSEREEEGVFRRREESEVNSRNLEVLAMFGGYTSSRKKRKWKAEDHFTGPVIELPKWEVNMLSENSQRESAKGSMVIAWFKFFCSHENI